jgi:hypothetical protein
MCKSLIVDKKYQPYAGAARATITNPADAVDKSGATPLLACLIPAFGIPGGPTPTLPHCSPGSLVCANPPHGHGEVHFVQGNPNSAPKLMACALPGSGRTTTGYAQKHVYFVSASAPAFSFVIEQMVLHRPAPEGQTVSIVRVAHDPLGRMDPVFWRSHVYYFLRVVWDGFRPLIRAGGSATGWQALDAHDFEEVNGELILRRPVEITLRLDHIPEHRWRRHASEGGHDKPNEETEWPAVVEALQASVVHDDWGSEA